MKTKKIKIPIYGDKWIIIVCNDLNKVLKKYNIEGDITHVDGFCYSKDGTHITAFLKKHLTHDNIAHECVHLLNDIYSFNEVKLDINNDESQAYLMGWLVKQLYKFIKL